MTGLVDTVKQPFPEASEGKKVMRRRRGQRKCEHNDWDNVRIEKRSVKVITLRCRVCQCQKKVPLTKNWKCEDFSAGACNTEGCKKLHVNQRKQSLEERIRIHGVKLVEPRASPLKILMALNECGAYEFTRTKKSDTQSQSLSSSQTSTADEGSTSSNDVISDNN
eukprot:TRINITY_DN17213_c0_g1_i1.p1 TRINITY_DN17213_c0_g1~~TRINITY_DN17213_c0_g1_i1.p1  ORF type:complete len:165 (+),score=32.30 TRINITY_DN17213_c0_g1_i1:102-596(+)